MSNASGGAAPFQVSESAKLLAKDSSKDLAVLRDLLNRLKDKELNGLIDEIEQKIKALKDSADKIGKVAEKISELMPDTIGGEDPPCRACRWDHQGLRRSRVPGDVHPDADRRDE